MMGKMQPGVLILEILEIFKYYLILEIFSSSKYILWRDNRHSQPAVTCSKSTIEMQEQSVKYVQS